MENNDKNFSESFDHMTNAYRNTSSLREDEYDGYEYNRDATVDYASTSSILPPGITKSHPDATKERIPGSNEEVVIKNPDSNFKSSSKEKKCLTVNVDLELFERIRKQAFDEGVQKTVIMRKALIEYLDRNEVK